jgi:hypothetical protein
MANVNADIVFQNRQNRHRTYTFQSLVARPEQDSDDAPDPIFNSWPSENDPGDIDAGLYQLSPKTEDTATFNIILYLEAFSFIAWYGFQRAKEEIKKITDCFGKTIPELFPDASVLLLWNRTMSDFGPNKERRLRVTCLRLWIANRTGTDVIDIVRLCRPVSKPRKSIALITDSNI